MSPTVEQRYALAVSNPTDINELIPVLYDYGRRCARITEFGVREGVSTTAWLMAKPIRLVCYDIGDCPAWVSEVAKNNGTGFTFYSADTASVDIDETDLLFVDTVHNGDHLLHEIGANHNRVNRFILLHDTETYGRIGESGARGLMSGLHEFLAGNNEWAIREQRRESNGLTVLEKRR